MKPLCLTMSAFGSYRDRTVIDFTEAGNGVFLIAGDTGSGKTTIFDGITYALYGETSGGKRDGKMMRSQYAGPDQETYVELVFSCRGKQYKVVRNPEYMREKKRGTGLAKTAASVELTLPDGTVFRGRSRDTDRKICELLGIDREQFTRIAMIAQGDFLKLLHAGSEERKKIFSRIFDTGICRAAEEEISERRKAARERLGASGERLKTHIRSIVLPEGERTADAVFPVQEEIPDAEKIRSLLETWVHQERERKSALESRSRELDEALKQALEERGKRMKAGEIRRQYREKEEQLQKEEEKLGDYTERREWIERFSRARNIRPYQERADRAETGEQEAVEGKRKAESRLKDAEECMRREKSRLEAAQEQYREREPALRRELEKLEQERKEWERLERLERMRKEAGSQKEAMHAESGRMKEKADRIRDRIAVCRGRKREWEESLPESAGLEAAYRKAGEYEKAAEELKKEREKLNIQKEELEVLSAEQEKRIGELSGIRERYRELEERFFREQAGILARDHLKEGCPCPVCGSLSHPLPAGLPAEAPSEEELRTMAETCEEKSRQCQEAGLVISEKQAAIREKENSMRQQEKEIPDNYRTEKQRLEQRLKELHRLEETGKQAAAELSELEKQLEETDQALKDTEIRAASQEAEEKRLLEEIRLAGQQMKFSSPEEVLMEKTRMEKEREDLNRVAEKIRDMEKAAAEELSSAVQGLASAGDLLEIRRKEKKEAGEAWKKAWETGKFSDRTAYETALTWKKEEEAVREKEETDEYFAGLARLRAEVTALKPQVSGEEDADMEALEKEICALQEEKACAEKEREEVSALLKNHEEAGKRIMEEQEKAGGLTEEFLLYDTLWQTASGNLRGKAKIDFETYVQRRYFEKILAAANRRFLKLSGDRLKLKSRSLEESGGQGHSGLDLNVLVMATGKERDVKTLSGGESFLASLSLALGLSDVVQSQAGAVRVDAMFVDEGFGSLDDETRDLAVKVLHDLAGDDRMVGIISHVNELKEQIGKKLMVSKGTGGSTVRWAVEERVF